MATDVDYYDLNGKPRLIKGACPTLRLEGNDPLVKENSEAELNRNGQASNIAGSSKNSAESVVSLQMYFLY